MGGPDLQAAVRLVDAVTAARSTTSLYPDPRGKPPFERSLEILDELADESLVLDVDQDGFAVDGEAVPSTHAAAAKLARALFLHNVGSIAVVKPPTSDELVGLFRELATEPTAEVLDFQAQLDRAGISAFRVRDRATLVERAPRPEEDTGQVVERPPEVAATFELATRPEQLARTLLEEAAATNQSVGEVFAERYATVTAQIATGDWVAKEKLVQGFVDAFCTFSDEHRLEVLEEFLPHQGEPFFQHFLDQFAARELATLAPHLTAPTFTLLLEYARVVADEEGRSGTLASLLEGPDLAGARAAVSVRVNQRLQDMRAAAYGAEHATEALQEEIQSVTVGIADGVEVLRVLFEVEQRPYRIRRLLRIWAGKVTTAIRQLDFETALAWFEGLAAGVSYLPAGGGQLDEAFTLVATPEMLSILTADVAEAEPGTPRRRLLEILGRHATAQLVDLLGTEDDAARRRMLIDVLAAVARVDPTPVVAHLADSRWFVVRNLAVALGKSGRPHAGPGLAGLLRHPDHRVRVEAMRALVPTMGGAQSAGLLIGGLGDESDRVRAAAVSLLAAVRDADHWKTLAAGIDRDDVPLEAKLKLVAMLGRIDSAGAADFLEELAQQRGRRGEARALRDAARQAQEARQRSA